MTKKDKLLNRVFKKPKDLTWNELVVFLSIYGYELQDSGKTSGSVRIFANAQGHTLVIHKPHPENTVLPYVINKVMNKLNLK